MPFPEPARALLQIAVADYERVLALQSASFGPLSVHARGELLAGLAEGWHGLGDPDKAQGYLTRILTELPGSGYAEKARAWLEHGTPAGRLSCSGCHTR